MVLRVCAEALEVGYLTNNPRTFGEDVPITRNRNNPCRGTLSILAVTGTAPVGEYPQGFQHGLNPAYARNTTVVV